MAEWRARGQTSTAFSEGEPFTASGLRYWAHRLGKEPRPRRLRVVRVERQQRAAELTAGVDASLMVEVGPARVVVRPGFDRALLATALAAEQAALSVARELVTMLTAERDHLKASHERPRLELELLRWRIFVAKAERVGTAQLELEFAATLAALDQLGGGPPARLAAEAAAPKKPTARRDLRDLKLPVERVELFDVIFEKLVAEGKAERFGFEESRKVAWQRGARMLVQARAKYRTVDAAGESMIETTPMPPELFPRSLAAPSLLAHVVAEKFCDGLPLDRIEDRMAREGFPLDRGTMSRWVEDAGTTVGATVVAAAREEAWATAFCVATDATGIAVQPGLQPEGKRPPRHRSHCFVQIAAPHAARGRAGADGPAGLTSTLARSSQSRPQPAALTLRPPAGVRAASGTAADDLNRRVRPTPVCHCTPASRRTDRGPRRRAAG